MAVNIDLKPYTFQSEASGLIQTCYKVHVLHCLTAGTFKKVVDNAGDKQLIAMLFDTQDALVRIDDLLEVNVGLTDVCERVRRIVAVVQFVRLFPAKVAVEIDGRQDA